MDQEELDVVEHQHPTVNAHLLEEPEIRTSTLFMLLCVALLPMGVSWTYDFPGAMYSFLADRFGVDDYSLSKNEVLYSVYNWPNVVMVLLAGFTVDRWLGLQRSTLLLAFSILLGQFIFSTAIQWRTYPMAVFGRFVFGLGGAAISVAQSTWIVLLSDASNMAWRFGIVLTVSRLASALNFAVTPAIGQSSISAAIWLGSGINVVSFVAAIILFRARNPNLDETGRVLTNTDTPIRFITSSRPTGASVCYAVHVELMAIYYVLRSFPAPVWIQFAICIFYHVGVLLLYQIASILFQGSGAPYS